MTMTMDTDQRLYHSPRGLYPFQGEFVAHGYLRHANLVVADTGLGKLVRDSEPILTPQGWKSADTIEVGDLVVGVDGRGHPVTGVFPQPPSQIVRMTFSDGSYADTSWDHLWTVQDARNDRPTRHPDEHHDGLPAGRWRTMTTRQIADAGVKYKGGGRKWRIPLVAPVEFEMADVSLPIDPYTLGVWLAEGTAGTLNLNIEDAPFIAERIGSPWREVAGRPGSAQIRLLRHLPLLRELGLLGLRSWEKFIPDDYLFAGVNDRLALLQGLMDGDGSSVTPCHNEFSTTSPRLRDGVIHLVQSLGGVCRLGKVRRTTYTHNEERRMGRESYRMGVKLPPQMAPFSVPRKLASFRPIEKYLPTRMIESIEEVDVDDARCFRVDSPSNLYVMSQFVVTHNTHIGLATAAMLFEDDKIDLVIFVVEGNKLDEWKDDIETFTRLTAAVYHGTGRKKILSRPLPQAIVTTYHTSKADIASEDAPLTRVLMNAHSRVLVVYDEMALLGTSRTSKVYESHHRFVNILRRRFGVRVMGLTATPMTSSPENYFNIARILDPALAGTVDSFYRDHVAGYDQWGNPNKFKNLSDDHCAPGVVSLARKMEPLILRKRKTDPDVIDKFPRLVEKFVPIELEADHLDAYHDLDEAIEVLPDAKRRFAFQSLIAFSCHPRSLLHSESEYIQAWVSEYGPNNLLRMKSAKSDALVGYLREILSQEGRDGIIVFSYHTSVLHCLSEDLTKAKIDHVRYDGSMSQGQRDAAKASFKSGQARVLLASSAAERGVNLPEAAYIVNYDVPILHSSYLQRLSRGSRIDAKEGGILVVKTFIGRGTIEQAAVRLWNRRNDWSDKIQDFDADEDEFVSASERLALIRRAAREGEAST